MAVAQANQAQAVGKGFALGNIGIVLRVQRGACRQSVRYFSECGLDRRFISHHGFLLGDFGGIQIRTIAAPVKNRQAGRTAERP